MVSPAPPRAFADPGLFHQRVVPVSAAYWVQFDAFTPGAFATIDARLSGRNEVLIETQNLDGFTLKLDPATDWKVRVDGRRFASKSLRFHKRADWQEGPAPPPRKRTGGILEALGARHVYIHAEGDRETAERLAAWSTPRKPLLLTLRSFPENAVTPEDVNGANLVLLPGVKAEGLLAARAPLRLNPGAADYTFLTTAEAPDRQVVLIQGRPPASLAPHPFPPHLNNDYVLLRGEEVLAQGIYTKNWELPPGVRQKLLDTGVIEVAP